MHEVYGPQVDNTFVHLVFDMQITLNIACCDFWHRTLSYGCNRFF
jgi:hypothetical protein